MAEDAEFLFESTRLQVVNDLDVAVDRDGTPSVRFRPASDLLGIGDSDATNAGGSVEVRDRRNTVRATLEADTGDGRFRVTDRRGNPAVSIAGGGARPEVQAHAGEDVTVDLGTGSLGGRAAVYAVNQPTEPIAISEIRGGRGSFGPRGGHIQVRNTGGTITGILDGRDGAVVLRGGSEVGPQGSTRDAAYGGGDLVIGRADDSVNLHIHATAEEDSSYGVATENRPGVNLDGPTATLDIGRNRPSDAVPTGDGSLRIRDDKGRSVLEVAATSGSRSEMTFAVSDTSGVQTQGKVESHPDGLMISVNTAGSGGSTWEHALLLTKRGEVVTASPIQENASL